MWTGRKGDNLRVRGKGGLPWDRENRMALGWYYLLTLMKWSESHSVVSDSLLLHGLYILQARILEWVAFPFSRASSQPRDRTQVPHIAGDSLPAEPQGKPKNTAVGSLSLLQRIFPTQESNRGLLHCRWILYQLSYPGSHKLLSYYLKKGEAMVDTSNTWVPSKYFIWINSHRRITWQRLLPMFYK